VYDIPWTEEHLVGVGVGEVSEVGGEAHAHGGGAGGQQARHELGEVRGCRWRDLLAPSRWWKSSSPLRCVEVRGCRRRDLLALSRWWKSSSPLRCDAVMGGAASLRCGGGWGGEAAARCGEAA
jgi:hypothetical protein